MTTNDVLQEFGTVLTVEQWTSLDNSEARRLIRALIERSLKRSLQANELAIADEIATRRQLLWTKWKPKASPKSLLKKITVILAFAFGFGPRKRSEHWAYKDVWFGRVESNASQIVLAPVPEQYHPHFHTCGGSNEDNARLVDSIAMPETELRGQWEVVEQLRQAHHRPIPDEHVSMPQLDYLSTTSVVLQQLKSGLGEHSHILALSHPDHVLRCQATTEVLVNAYREEKGLDPATVLVPETSSIRYFGDSVQPWTREQSLFRAHEIAARVKALFHGRMRFEHLLGE